MAECTSSKSQKGYNFRNQDYGHTDLESSIHTNLDILYVHHSSRTTQFVRLLTAFCINIFGIWNENCCFCAACNWI